MAKNENRDATFGTTSAEQLDQVAVFYDERHRASSRSDRGIAFFNGRETCAPTAARGRSRHEKFISAGGTGPQP
jgi:hypothetical protein